MRAGGYADVERLNGALSEAELIKAVKGVHLIGIRSKTQITKNVIEAADKLLAVGAFCIGVNQVDLSAATEKGVAVFNAPYSNTRSVAELIIGLCVMLIRKIADKNAAAHKGEWLKDAKGSYRTPREDARNYRLRQYRFAGLDHGRGVRDECSLLRHRHKAAARKR